MIVDVEHQRCPNAILTGEHPSGFLYYEDSDFVKIMIDHFNLHRAYLKEEAVKLHWKADGE